MYAYKLILGLYVSINTLDCSAPLPIDGGAL